MCQQIKWIPRNILSEVSNQVYCYIWFPIWSPLHRTIIIRITIITRIIIIFRFINHLTQPKENNIEIIIIKIFSFSTIIKILNSSKSTIITISHKLIIKIWEQITNLGCHLSLTKIWWTSQQTFLFICLWLGQVHHNSWDQQKWRRLVSHFL